jgi:hypothetical protein
LAIVRPSITRPTARARRSGGTSEAAVNAATPKYAPCGTPEIKRAISSSGVIRRERAEQIAEREHQHQADQHRATRDLREENGDERRADHHAQRIRADDVARGGQRRTEAVRDDRQDRHGRELTRADCQAPDGEGEFGGTRAIGRDHARERVIGDIDNGH